MVDNGQKKQTQNRSTSAPFVYDGKAVAATARGGGGGGGDNANRSLPQVYPGLPNPSGLCHIYFPTQGRNTSSPIREERYPSVEERICLRMHYWYDPRFNTPQAWKSPYSFKYVTDEQGSIDVIVHNNRTNDSINREGFDRETDSSLRFNNMAHIPDRIFFANIHEPEVPRGFTIMMNWTKGICKKTPTTKRNRLCTGARLLDYADDMAPFMDIVDRHWNKTKNEWIARGEQPPPPPPILMQFGDAMLKRKAFLLPVLIKWKYSDMLTTSEVEGIVCKMESPRHFADVPMVATDPVPWEKKTNVAIFRGGLNSYNHTYKVYAGEMGHLWSNQPPGDDIKLTINPNWTLQEGCFMFERCRLVYNLHNSSLVDAGLTDPLNVSGRELSKPSVGVADLLQYKMLISIEGNDVATGLKWNLMSNSVVLMVPPFKSTFVLENLLEPWVHYVPLEPALDRESVEERVRWVLDHEDEARAIAARARTFMEDLWLYQHEEAEIMDKIAQRYLALWD